MSLFKRKAKPVTNLNKRAKSLDRISEEVEFELDNNINDNISQDSNYQSIINQPSTSQNAQSFHVIESLKIPDVIKDLQVFDGNPKLLQYFIDNVEEILLLCRGYEATPQGTIFLRAIRNKITGDANETLNSYHTPLIWETIKENLIITYGDNRDETTLIKDLHNLNQDFMSIEDFYGNIVEIQAALLNRIVNTENNKIVFEAKKKLYLEMCLNSFTTGIRGPLGPMLRSIQPSTLSSAFAYIMKEKNISNKNRYPINNRQYQYNRYNQTRPQHNYSNPFNRQPVNQHQQYNRRQNFNEQIGNYQPAFNNTNNFRNMNNQQLRQIKQSPSTMFRNNNNNNSRNTSYSRQSRNLKLEEINNINNKTLDEPEDCNIDEEQNFQYRASPSQPQS